MSYLTDFFPMILQYINVMFVKNSLIIYIMKKENSIVDPYEVNNYVFSFRHVFLLGKCRLWGGWDLEWAVRLDDVVAVPHLVANKLIFKVRQVTTRNHNV
jgi:hypothetical protein